MQDGWITCLGFTVCAAKAGVRLSRTEFLALERAVPKDNSGRINFFTLAERIGVLAIQAQAA
jgi:hypothetical protein